MVEVRADCRFDTDFGRTGGLDIVGITTAYAMGGVSKGVTISIANPVDGKGLRSHSWKKPT